MRIYLTNRLVSQFIFMMLLVCLTSCGGEEQSHSPFGSMVSPSAHSSVTERIIDLQESVSTRSLPANSTANLASIAQPSSSLLVSQDSSEPHPTSQTTNTRKRKRNSGSRTIRLDVKRQKTTSAREEVVATDSLSTNEERAIDASSQAVINTFMDVDLSMIQEGKDLWQSLPIGVKTLILSYCSWEGLQSFMLSSKSTYGLMNDSQVFTILAPTFKRQLRLTPTLLSKVRERLNNTTINLLPSSLNIYYRACLDHKNIYELQNLELTSQVLGQMSGLQTLHLRSIDFPHSHYQKNLLQLPIFQMNTKNKHKNNFAGFMQAISKLKAIRIADGTIGDKGAIVIEGMLKSMPLLQELALFNCKTITSKGLSKMIEAVDKSRLNNLCLVGNQFMKRDGTENEMLQKLHHFQSLKKLQLANLKLTKSNIIPYQKDLAKLTSLEELDLSENAKIGLDGLGTLIREVFPKLPNLHTLKYADNRIGSYTAKVKETTDLKTVIQQFAAYLQTVKLRNFDLSWNSLGDQALISLVNNLQTTELQELNLSANKIGDEGVVALANNLNASSPCCLEVLNLSMNKITSGGLKALSEVLLKSPSLRTINLSDNEIDDEGVAAVTKNLNTSCLEVLNLSKNKITSGGLRTLSTALQNAIRLHTLDLSKNKINTDEPNTLFSTLQKLPNLRTLKLSENNLTDRQLLEFVGHLQTMRLQEIDLSNNKISEEVMKSLANVLRQSKDLLSLNLSRNETAKIVADSVVIELLNGLAEGTSKLQELHLAGNIIGEPGCKALVNILNKNSFPKLKVLKLSVDMDLKQSHEIMETLKAIKKQQQPYLTIKFFVVNANMRSEEYTI